ncbi:MAG: hypothetical protein ACPGEC_02155 [Flavobacteriales bacterium]
MRSTFAKPKQLKDSQSFKQFSEMLLALGADLEHQSTCEDLCTFIEVKVLNFSQLMIALGDLEKRKEPAEPQELYLFNYLIVKSLNIFFINAVSAYYQLSKIRIELLENAQRTQEQSAIEPIKTQLLEDIEALKRFLEPEALIRTWAIDAAERTQHQANPWDVYKNHFQSTQKQVEILSKTVEKAQKQALVFQDIKRYINQSIQDIEVYFSEKEQFISNLLVNFKSTDLLTQLEQELEISEEESQQHHVFSQDLETKMTRLQTLEVPMSYRQGKLEFKRFELSNVLKKWLDFEILAKFFDIWLLQDGVDQYVKLQVRHIVNHIKVQGKRSEDIDYELVESSLNQLKMQIGEKRTKFLSFIPKIETELNQKLSLSSYYRFSVQFDIPLKHSIGYRRNQLLIRLKTIYKTWKDRLFDTSHIIETSAKEQALGLISERQSSGEDEQYDALFLNKNFIGDLFIVPRLELQNRYNQALELWSQGFFQSILLYGNRLSGKSTLMHFFSNQESDGQLIELTPFSTIRIGNKTFQVKRNLLASLKWMEEHSLSNQKLRIHIDDIERWSEGSKALSSNIKALLNVMLNKQQDWFFVVSVNDMTFSRLDSRFELKHQFTTLLDTSKSSLEAIVQAVQIRHGASHKLLRTKTGEEFTPSKIKNSVSNFAEQAKHNIGQTLQIWTYQTRIKHSAEVILDSESKSFSNLFSFYELLIIKQIYLNRVVRSSGLQAVFPKAQQHQFYASLQQLLGLKVVLESKRGQYNINPLVITEVELFLNQSKND